MLYRQLADLLLRLSSPSLPRIGALSQIDDFTWEVMQRPLSMNMNELTLADLNLEHLIHQRNDAVESADDCRRKFIARKLFQKLTRDKRLTNPSLEKGPFKIWCDDLRPASILLNGSQQIVGVVDWEFTYAAPVEFSCAPPWWLLVEKPEYWPQGLEDWTRVFDYRLKTFLQVMKDCEDAAIQQARLNEDQRLSGPMGQRGEHGNFWVMYAVLHSFAFDTIYWQKIDPRLFGSVESTEGAWKQRLDLLDAQEKDEMEALVAPKLEEMKNRVLAWDPDEYPTAFRQQLKERRERAAEADDVRN